MGKEQKACGQLKIIQKNYNWKLVYGSRKKHKIFRFLNEVGEELKACKALKERLKLWENGLELGQSWCKASIQ